MRAEIKKTVSRAEKKSEQQMRDPAIRIRGVETEASWTALRRELAGELNLHGLGYVLKEQGEQNALVFFVAEAARQEALLKLQKRRPNWRLEFYGAAAATQGPVAPRSGDLDTAAGTAAPAEPVSEVPSASVRPSMPLEHDDWAESFEERNFDDDDEASYWKGLFKEQKEQQEWDEASEQPPTY